MSKEHKNRAKNGGECNCKSYNWKKVGKIPEKILKLPDHLCLDRQNRNVSIDACIAHVIKWLWKSNIETLGCCCGHNRYPWPTLIIDSGYSEIEINHIKELIYIVDNRDWRIKQWKLMEV